MNPQSFIQSGLLEAYVLGLSSPQERAEVERMAAAHVEVREELAAIERTLETYAQARGEAPPAWMKGRILDRLGEGEPPAAEPVADTAAVASRFGFLQLLAFALGLATVAFGYLYWQQLRERRALENDVTAVRQQVAACQEQQQQTEQYRLQVDAQLKMLRDPDTRRLLMTDGKEYQVYAFVNPLRNTVAIDLASVPAPPPNKYIQFWFLDAKGTPVSLGMVQRQGDWQTFAYHPDARQYAISAEDNPQGNPTPTQVLAISGKS